MNNYKNTLVLFIGLCLLFLSSCGVTTSEEDDFGPITYEINGTVTSSQSDRVEVYLINRESDRVAQHVSAGEEGSFSFTLDTSGNFIVFADDGEGGGFSSEIEASSLESEKSVTTDVNLSSFVSVLEDSIDGSTISSVYLFGVRQESNEQGQFELKALSGYSLEYSIGLLESDGMENVHEVTVTVGEESNEVSIQGSTGVFSGGITLSDMEIDISSSSFSSSSSKISSSSGVVLNKAPLNDASGRPLVLHWDMRAVEDGEVQVQYGSTDYGIRFSTMDSPSLATDSGIYYHPSQNGGNTTLPVDTLLDSSDFSMEATIWLNAYPNCADDTISVVVGLERGCRFGIAGYEVWDLSSGTYGFGLKVNLDGVLEFYAGKHYPPETYDMVSFSKVTSNSALKVIPLKEWVTVRAEVSGVQVRLFIDDEMVADNTLDMPVKMIGPEDPPLGNLFSIGWTGPTGLPRGLLNGVIQDIRLYSN